jgi:transposase
MSDHETDKRGEMMKNGSYNHRADAVTNKLFQRFRFFDAHDVMQVKYEMLRAVEKDNCDITEAAEAFGFSRVSFYQARKDFEANGIAGLIPKKRGPKGSRKVNESDIEFAKALIGTHTKAQIVMLLKEERGVEISKRTLERQLSDKKNA